MKLWPKKLAGQMALLVGVALLIAQLINFGFLFAERWQARENQVISPAIARLVDAVERVENGQPLFQRQGRAGRRAAFASDDSLIEVDASRADAIERHVKMRFQELELNVLDVRARVIKNSRPRPSAYPGAAPDGPPRSLLIISVQLPTNNWLNVRASYRAEGPKLIVRLLIQTFVIFIVLLIAVLWIGNRATRPLKALTQTATRFGGATNEDPVLVAGPSDIRQLIEAFNKMQLRISDMLGEKDRMLGAVGHDLRTPLASLRLRVEAITDAGERQKAIDSIDEMNCTLEDILSLARIGRPSDPSVDIDLVALVDAVALDLVDLGEDVTIAPSDRILVNLRPAPTRRAVRNIIENAIKYGTRAHVSVSTSSNEALVTVEDEGPGIPEPDIERVMDGFVRLETSRNRETGGSGLGLAIARGILREQGGDLHLENREKKGLKVTLKFLISEMQK
ncbi:MAG: HAMP domain-containing sensor histidine kinase [Hyphomicrobiales bacterium]